MSFKYNKSLPKIHLDSIADLKYLSINFNKTIQEKLKKHIPKNVSNNSEDILRKKVEDILENFATKTFELAKPNIIINGIEAQKTIVDDYVLEPFDYDLNNKLQSLHNEIEETILKTTQLRREIPKRIFEHESDQNISEIKINLPEISLIETIKTKQIVEPKLERENEIKEEYTNAISIMKQLKTARIPFHKRNS
ncbi:uncharacterized protein T551_02903 [Pneumocystis jirovecii RU7]|uniref:Uncharacterized protein n=1 Tax=Pneumocystis jirovecii (strain RU7) TaxID=1408657 RepID=A0A0W4ZHU0_PNEJ7|nr:uncharacterized protein T551_02903 [Pneumocystis jirovecii RU7]KTW27936.1 hypothetical protein T551_02903 [Pneumocystis jirovecii RU7]